MKSALCADSIAASGLVGSDASVPSAPPALPADELASESADVLEFVVNDDSLQPPATASCPPGINAAAAAAATFLAWHEENETPGKTSSHVFLPTAPNAPIDVSSDTSSESAWLWTCGASWIWRF